MPKRLMQTKEQGKQASLWGTWISLLALSSSGVLGNKDEERGPVRKDGQKRAVAQSVEGKSSEKPKKKRSKKRGPIAYAGGEQKRRGSKIKEVADVVTKALTSVPGVSRSAAIEAGSAAAAAAQSVISLNNPEIPASAAIEAAKAVVLSHAFQPRVKDEAFVDALRVLKIDMDSITGNPALDKKLVEQAYRDAARQYLDAQGSQKAATAGVPSELTAARDLLLNDKAQSFPMTIEARKNLLDLVKDVLRGIKHKIVKIVKEIQRRIGLERAISTVLVTSPKEREMSLGSKILSHVREFKVMITGQKKAVARRAEIKMQ